MHMIHNLDGGLWQKLEVKQTYRGVTQGGGRASRGVNENCVAGVFSPMLGSYPVHLKSEEATPLLDQRFYQNFENPRTGTRGSFKFSKKVGTETRGSLEK